MSVQREEDIEERRRSKESNDKHNHLGLYWLTRSVFFAPPRMDLCCGRNKARRWRSACGKLQYIIHLSQAMQAHIWHSSLYAWPCESDCFYTFCANHPKSYLCFSVRQTSASQNKAYIRVKYHFGWIVLMHDRFSAFSTTASP